MTETRYVDFRDSEEIIRDIRHRVFTLEQGVDTAIDFDGLDQQAVQVLAFEDGTPVGTGRMLHDGHIGRIAVLEQCRGRGVGAAVIRALVEKARDMRLRRVYLGAQVNAVPFYEKLGFSRNGQDYTEAGILHTPMSQVFESIKK